MVNNLATSSGCVFAEAEAEVRCTFELGGMLPMSLCHNKKAFTMSIEAFRLLGDWGGFYIHFVFPSPFRKDLEPQDECVLKEKIDWRNGDERTKRN